MIHISTEKFTDIRNPQVSTYQMRIWYQWSKDDVYGVADSSAIPTPLGIFGFSADLLKKDISVILAYLKANAAIDLNALSIIGFIWTYKSDVMFNNKRILFKDIATILWPNTELIGPPISPEVAVSEQLPPSGLNK